MPKPYSNDLRRKVVDAIILDGMKRCEASEHFNLSRNTIYNWLKCYEETGDIQHQARTHSGHSHKITDWEAFRIFVVAHADKTQSELAELWEDEISDRTISRALKKIGFTRKKKTYGYKERDEQARVIFLKQLATLKPEEIVYADESGMDNRDDYGYGYSPKGERLHALKAGKRAGRVNMIAALCNHQLLAPFTLEGACNRGVFELWLEHCLIPELKPGQKLVIDNATFHKGGKIEQLVEAAGCEVWYLPPYSPDFNKIEQQWSVLKSRIRKQIDQFPTLRSP